MDNKLFIEELSKSTGIRTTILERYNPKQISGSVARFEHKDSYVDYDIFMSRIINHFGEFDTLRTLSLMLGCIIGTYSCHANKLEYLNLQLNNTVNCTMECTINYNYRKSILNIFDKKVLIESKLLSNKDIALTKEGLNITIENMRLYLTYDRYITEEMLNDIRGMLCVV